jgi:PAS domain-containing protein
LGRICRTIFVQQRTLKSVAVLHAGTSVIGSGNLDYRIDEMRRDEIGDLSRAFNRMTADLKAVTSSKTDLEREIAERKQAEEELRQSEEKYRTLNFTMNEGVCLHEIHDESKDYRILDINPAYESITGLTREQAVGKKASELYGTGEPPYLDIYSRVAASGIAESFEVYFAPMQKHFSISAFSPGKGRFATVFSDITERKKAEQIKDEFIGLVSHEIKTPLTGLIGARSTANLDGSPRDEARSCSGTRLFTPICSPTSSITCSSCRGPSRTGWSSIRSPRISYILPGKSSAGCGVSRLHTGLL